MNPWTVFNSNKRFYTDEDTRARSVVEITSSIATCPLGNPLPNGVYDPRMGPSTADSPPCVTCAQRHNACPGHFGHIELCVPLYHPLLFSQIVEFLRMKCLNCHKLRLPARQRNVYETKFMLLENGEYHQVQELDLKMAAKMKEIKDNVDGAGDDSGKRQKALTLHNAGIAVDELLADIQTKCSRMGRNRSQRKKTRSAADSVFEEELRRQLVKEIITSCKTAKSCPNCGAFSPKIRQDSGNKIFQLPLSLTAKRANAADGIKLQSAMVNSSMNDQGDERMNGYDSDEFHSAKEDYDNDDDDSSEDENMNLAKDNYMHASEVQAQIRLTWATNPELCNSIFSIHGPEIFFVQAIPVPPNRFRPPMSLGGMIVEHIQNGYLNSILQANEKLRNNFASSNESGAYETWIELQTHFNCLLDSSKDPSSNPNPPMGIRQLLERKEGIFRKHMMGKRVNYACRSVISPDPYIGTNEIGLPRYFAETLTYPTPVTEINIGEMINLVERGPSQYPGARWVEFPDRRVDLSKMDDHKREAIASRLLMYSKKGSKPAIVGRQLRDGDMVLMNRQPTLHKPGIMGHQVRVLHDPKQKTIRMHYASKFI